MPTISLFSKELWKDLLTSYMAQSAVVISGIIGPALVARFAGIDSLGIYLLVRRVGASSVAVLTLGVATALSRYLPTYGRSVGTQVRWSLLAISIAAGFTLACLSIPLAYPAATAKILFGDSSLKAMLHALAALTLGTVVHATLYGHYRGILEIQSANWLQAINVGVAPLVSISFIHRIGVVGSLTLTGLITLCVCFVFMFPLFRKLRATRGDVEAGWSKVAGRRLLGYGIGRAPAFFFAGLLFMLGPIALAHKSNMAAVALFALALNLVRLGESAISPLGVVLLPRIALLLHEEGDSTVTRDMKLLFEMVVPFACFVCLQVGALHNTLFELWLGTVPSGGDRFFVSLVLVLPFYMAYELLRHPIDAAAVAPYNSIALSVAALIVAVGSYARSEKVIVDAQVCAFFVLGTLTVLVWKQLYKVQNILTVPFVLLLAFSGVSALWSWELQSRFPGNSLALVLNETILLSLFLGLTAWSGSQSRRKYSRKEHVEKVVIHSEPSQYQVESVRADL